MLLTASPPRSVEKLTDMAVDQGGAVPAALSKGPGSGELGGRRAADRLAGCTGQLSR